MSDQLHEFTLLQKILLALTFICFISTFIYIAAAWKYIPEQIPTHFNAAGEADARGGKESILLLPIIEIPLFMIMTIILFIPNVWNTPGKISPENRPICIRYTRTLLCFINFAILLTFMYMTIQSSLCNPLGAWFLPFNMVIIFFPVIIYLIKILPLREH